MVKKHIKFDRASFKVLWDNINADQSAELIRLSRFTDEERKVFMLMYVQGARAKGVEKAFGWNTEKADREIDKVRNKLIKRALNNPDTNEFYSYLYEMILKNDC